MSRLTVGDLSQSLSLARHQAQLKIGLNRAMQEMTSGQAADPGQALRGDFRGLSALDATLTRLDAYRTTAGEADMIGNALMAAFDTIGDLADTRATALLSAGTTGTEADLDLQGRQSALGLATVLAALNTRVADRALFSGTQTQRPALPDAETLLSTLQLSLGAVATASDVEAAVTAWFDAPTGFGALYQGGPALAPMDVAAGVAVDLGPRAVDPALRDTVKALAMAALLDRGVLSGNPAERADLARRSGQGLLSSGSARTALAAKIGMDQERIAQAMTRNAAEHTSLSVARTDLLAVDPYEAATRLQAVETQLQSLYTITGRLARLSLADYI